MSVRAIVVAPFLVPAILLVAGCNKPSEGAAPASSSSVTPAPTPSAPATVPTVAAAPSASGPSGTLAEGASPHGGPAPPQVKITGTVHTMFSGFMPAAKNGGKTQGTLEMNGTWTMDPPLAASQALKDVLEIHDAPATVTPALAAATGCKLTADGFYGTLGLDLTATEPGCDASKMLQAKPTGSLEVKTHAIWKGTKTSVPVTIEITIAPPKH